MDLYKTDEALAVVIALFCFTFCVLAFFVFLYFLRKKFRLYLEKKKISDDKLWFPSYQNHLKNLKIQSMISNFVIIIILVEFVNSIAILQLCVWSLISSNITGVVVGSYIMIISRLCHVPLLCLFLKVLWLAYLHSPYKYTIMRWTAYILLRICVILIADFGLISGYFNGCKYANLFYLILSYGISSTFLILDLVTYLIYSRRFYLHLKSRELEAKLFINRRKYLENRYLRKHFQITTILIAIALVFYILGNFLSLICTTINNIFFSYLNEVPTTWYLLNQSMGVLPLDIIQIIYRILFNLNYMYLIFIILFRKCDQKRKLYRINDKIQPLVKKYHEKYCKSPN